VKKWLFIGSFVIIAFVAYNLWATDQDAHEILDGSTRAGVLRGYSCGERNTPSITVSPDWATLRAQTQRGVLNAVRMLWSTTADVDVQEQ